MSGGVFRYDLEELTGVRSGLEQLEGDYAQASSTRKEADGALGYSDLRGAMREFVDNWKHERNKQLEAIRGTSKALDKIIDNYVQLDESAAADLREDCGP